MIPTKGWRPLSSAPINGETIMLRSREWNNPSAAFQVQAGQWLCDQRGKNWGWHLPARPGAKIYAQDWMTFEEFRNAQCKGNIGDPVLPVDFFESATSLPPLKPDLTRIMDPDPEEDEFAYFQSNPDEEDEFAGLTFAPPPVKFDL